MEKSFMTITVEAVYENGVLRPVQPLPLDERQKVQVTVDTAKTPQRDHLAFLNSYAPEDEGLYDAYPAG
jgi:predicted DNA-binding antitoxin AbrB/MazE fold protein